MRISTKVKLSDEARRSYVVTSLSDQRYFRIWNKSSLAYYSKSVYGVSFSDWVRTHRGVYHGWVLKPHKKSNKMGEFSNGNCS